MIAWLPLVVALVGLVVYYAAPGKSANIGLGMFIGGVTGMCVAFAGRMLRIL